MSRSASSRHLQLLPGSGTHFSHELWALILYNDLRPSMMFHPGNFELFHQGLRGVTCPQGLNDFWSPVPQQTTFNALAEVPSLTSKSTRSTSMHWLQRTQRGNIPGRGGSGRDCASHVGQRNSLITNRITSHIAPACCNARASSVGCGCHRLRCCRKSSRFSRSDRGRAQFRRPRLPLGPDVSARKYLPDQEAIFLLKMLSQHSILVTRQVNCSFSLQCLAQFLL